MRIAVLADIHANALALKAVLEHASGQNVERWWFLGDAVGYGPRPIPVVLWLKAWVDPNDWVMGNHDAMLAELLTPEQWKAVNQEPQQALALNREALRRDEEADAIWQAEFTRERIDPKTHTLEGVDYTLIHSSWSDPLGLERYIYPWNKDFQLPNELKSLWRVARQHGRPHVQCFGHTHLPTLVLADATGQDEAAFDLRVIQVQAGFTYQLGQQLTLINPGSVGQPRDGDRRAAYCLLDTGERTVTFHRMPYDFREVADMLDDLHYPASLRQRLLQATLAGNPPPEWRAHFEGAGQEVGHG